jgi:low temperature requirement protein LtrA
VRGVEDGAGATKESAAQALQVDEQLLLLVAAVLFSANNRQQFLQVEQDRAGHDRGSPCPTAAHLGVDVAVVRVQLHAFVHDFSVAAKTTTIIEKMQCYGTSQAQTKMFENAVLRHDSSSNKDARMCLLNLSRAQE